MINYDKIKIKGNNKAVHCCPVIKKEYIGDCNIISCPLNISQTKPGVGGCFNQVANPSLLDAARWNNMTVNEAKKAYKKSLNTIEKFLNFYMWLQNHRLENISSFKDKGGCSKCGIPFNGDCLNTKRCNYRQKLIVKVFKRKPFTIEELNLKENKLLWEIVAAQHQGKIQVISERNFFKLKNSLLRLNIIQDNT